MRDITVQVSHNPGELADVANALSLHGVNLKTIAALGIGESGVLRFVPDDLDADGHAVVQAGRDGDRRQAQEIDAVEHALLVEHAADAFRAPQVLPLGKGRHL